MRSCGISVFAICEGGVEIAERGKSELLKCPWQARCPLPRAVVLLAILRFFLSDLVALAVAVAFDTFVSDMYLRAFIPPSKTFGPSSIIR